DRIEPAPASSSRNARRVMPAICPALLPLMSPWWYHWTAAANRSSSAKCAGPIRRAENASSGTSILSETMEHPLRRYGIVSYETGERALPFVRPRNLPIIPRVPQGRADRDLVENGSKGD